MAIRIDDVHRGAPIPAQRGNASAQVPARRPAVPPSRDGGRPVAVARPVRSSAPTPGDVALGVVGLTLDAARSVVDVGTLVGQQTLDRLPVPSFVRAGLRRAVTTAGRTGRQRRDAVRAEVAALLDVVVPQVVRAVLARVDVARLVAEFVDLDRIAEGLDVDEIAARLDIDRVLARVDLDEVADRIDLDRAAARLDLEPILERVDLDELASRIDVERVVDRVDLDGVVGRVDLDRVVDRVDLDRAAARLDLDPILERADIVGLARYVIDAIDLPAIIRSSTGSITTDVVRGVRGQSADADEAVQRVVDRLLRRRGSRNDLAPGGER